MTDPAALALLADAMIKAADASAAVKPYQSGTGAFLPPGAAKAKGLPAAASAPKVEAPPRPGADLAGGAADWAKEHGQAVLPFLAKPVAQATGLPGLMALHSAAGGAGGLKSVFAANNDYGAALPADKGEPLPSPGAWKPSPHPFAPTPAAAQAAAPPVTARPPAAGKASPFPGRVAASPAAAPPATSGQQAAMDWVRKKYGPPEPAAPSAPYSGPPVPAPQEVHPQAAGEIARLTNFTPGSAAQREFASSFGPAGGNMPFETQQAHWANHQKALALAKENNLGPGTAGFDFFKKQLEQRNGAAASEAQVLRHMAGPDASYPNEAGETVRGQVLPVQQADDWNVVRGVREQTQHPIWNWLGHGQAAAGEGLLAGEAAKALGNVAGRIPAVAGAAGAAAGAASKIPGVAGAASRVPGALRAAGKWLPRLGAGADAAETVFNPKTQYEGAEEGKRLGERGVFDFSDQQPDPSPEAGGFGRFVHHAMKPFRSVFGNPVARVATMPASGLKAVVNSTQQADDEMQAAGDGTAKGLYDEVRRNPGNFSREMPAPFVAPSGYDQQPASPGLSAPLWSGGRGAFGVNPRVTPEDFARMMAGRRGRSLPEWLGDRAAREQYDYEQELRRKIYDDDENASRIRSARVGNGMSSSHGALTGPGGR